MPEPIAPIEWVTPDPTHPTAASLKVDWTLLSTGLKACREQGPVEIGAGQETVGILPGSLEPMPEPLSHQTEGKKQDSDCGQTEV